MPKDETAINVAIAEALGWNAWQDLRPGRDQWFQERPIASIPGKIEILHVPNYVGMLRLYLEKEHPELLPLRARG